jgi:hypothetical protein
MITGQSSRIAIAAMHPETVKIVVEAAIWSIDQGWRRRLHVGRILSRRARVAP